MQIVEVDGIVFLWIKRLTNDPRGDNVLAIHANPHNTPVIKMNRMDNFFCWSSAPLNQVTSGLKKPRWRWPNCQTQGSSQTDGWGNGGLPLLGNTQVQIHVTMSGCSRTAVRAHALTNSAAVHPSPPPPPLLCTAQTSCGFHVSDLCCCFLLWPEFYTVCQSPERHTL